ncbi:MAG: outer membrane lipid asymmetry maintenance protein MlaD [Desulfobacteraceae bacterium]|nr:outer membrane lipid asymmetry maintenance protein MlaD [Desulfobacteraceae bacterium]
MKKYASETWVGLFMTIGLICVGYMAIELGHVSLFGGDSYPLKARFSAISELHAGSPVTMMGIDIGQVTGVSLDQKDHQAVVQFRVRDGIEIYSDAIASIKTQGLIGEKYLDIDAGGAGDQLKPGGTITDTIPPVDLTDLIGKYAFGSVGGNK